MKTTVTLDDDVYEAAQALAQATGKPLGRVLSEMARQALRSSGPRAKRSAKRISRFPVFEVPPNTPMIPASRVQKALDEDGIV
ncbi:MAG: antitoxin [Thermoanaerobaculia bacterium]